MRFTFFKGVVLGSVVCFAMLTATAAFAGSGPGAVFNLGKYNGVNATSALAGTSAGPQLRVVNTSGASAATGVSVSVHDGKPPLVVNSSTKVKNLNADRLDGLDSSNFQRRVEFAVVDADGTLLRGSTGVTSISGSTGAYEMYFAHDVSACAFNATLSGEHDGFQTFSLGSIMVAKDPTHPEAVVVYTWNGTNATAAFPFDLTVTC